MKHLYGITIDEYDSMVAAQGGGCAICGGQNWSGKSLSIDHNHNTNKVRGLLCNNCNTAIGLLGERIEVLASAINYLKENG
jgi:hypothetical protein